MTESKTSRPLALQPAVLKRWSPGQIFRNIALISIGSVLCALAINGILIPQRFVSGGVSGLALVIHYRFPVFPVSTVYFVLNIPLFVMGWMFVGRRFFIYSIVGMLVFSGALQWVGVLIPLADPIPNALLAGIFNGVGSGLILRSLGSAGGTDILSVILLNRFSIRLGTTALAFNFAVLLLAVFTTSLEAIMYTLIFLYVSAEIMNLVVTGFSKRKAVFIISAQWESIAKGILNEICRGATILQGQGAYSGRAEKILYTVVSFQELSRVKRLIRAYDPDAFVVITDTLEVMGQGIGNQPHW